MSQKAEKPILQGQRIKTRKRGKFWSVTAHVMASYFQNCFIYQQNN